MQEDPVYDFPEPVGGEPVGERRACPQRGSLKNISVLDRLLLTHPVWLQLSINSATALHILQREPPGIFLVRKSNTSQKKVLCVRLADDSVPSFVKQFVIREGDSTFSLERAAIGFPDLFRLIAFYCVSRDVLPFPLELPEAIVKASSHKQLESISHMGVEFWSSQLNFRGPRNGPPPVEEAPLPPSPTPEDCATPQESPTLFQEFCPIQTRSPRELNCGAAGQGALCFINPLFLQSQPALHKRLQFKRSLKVRVSTENSSSLSPPVAPPPPPPLLAKKNIKSKVQQASRAVEGERGTAPVQEDSDYLHPCLVLPFLPQKTRVTPTLSPTAEEDYHVPLALLQGPAQEKGGEEVGLLLEQRYAPSLSELDSSSSLSSLEEAEESSERPPLTRGTSNPSPPCTLPPRQPVSVLRKLSAAFVSFFMPEKHVARLVEDLSRDRRTVFGVLVQDFLRQQREAIKPQCQRSGVELLQGIRLFLSQAKTFLLDCGELEPPIETMVPDDEKDLVLEKAMFRCVLKPLKGQIDRTLKTLHERDGSTQSMAESLAVARGKTPLECFGVRVGVPDAAGVEKVRQKLALMRRAYSPIDKVAVLLQVCKLIYKAMTDNSGQEFGADDFLPALSYVIVQCNMPELSVEVEYMMELLESSWLTGEGGYYLTSVYASLCLIQSQPEEMPSSGLTQEARDSLKDWSQRRSSQAQSQKNIQQQLRCVKVLFQDGESSWMKTLQWRAGVSGEALTQLCAAKFGVDNPGLYKLYWRSEGEIQALPAQGQIQDLQGQGTSGTPLIYQLANQDGLKTCKLTREEAVDLVESPGVSTR
ncbi:ras and Rab interactor 2-like [Coregonus clupeaformis]|uniref:ras and Rab interactor 2-like n=1 Tax=Coregonus clupeaformis TaxID=59861 RepID=UPI001BE0E3D7|nr:ras and Rab interactor 2-like [Coregonus clupeaformis]XP_041750288.1 ras and Rab interactor 2-like [Coregonus clupeaformis]XP_041750289.1 ras and Rab interactor 2-like [Coregonus clupeaformis]